MPEIAQKDLDALLNAKKLVDANWSSSDFRRKAKEIIPGLTIPEDNLDPVVAPLKAELDQAKGEIAKLTDTMTKWQAEQSDGRAEADMRAKLDAAAQEFGLTDEGRAKMIERMKETGNFTDPQSAAAWVVAKTPAPKPTNNPSWLPQALNPFGSAEKDEAWEKLHTNPEKYRDDVLAQFAADPIGFTNETLGYR